MRKLLLLFVLGLMLTVGAISAQETTCTVSENYLEALNEHGDTLLRLNVLLNTGGGVLNNLQTVEINHRLLRSMRRYHEERHAGLPACAQPSNLATMTTINATDDALTLLFLRELETTDPLRYEDDIRRAVDELRSRYAELGAARSATRLIPELSA